MYCLYCGATIAQDAQFCEKCGKRQNVSVATNTTVSTPPPAPATSSRTSAGLLLLFVALLLFFLFHVVPAIILAGLLFFWFFVLPHAGIVRKNAIAGTIVAVVVALGIQAYQSRSESERQSGEQQKLESSSQTQTEAQARTASQQAQIHPPSYRVYKSKTDDATAYVVPLNTSNEQLKSLLWLLRQKVRAGAFRDIGIMKPTSKNWGEYNYKAGMLLVYRGEKCANEEFVSNAQLEQGNLGPCGYGEHDDAYYQWGFPPTNKEGFVDEGAVREKSGDMTVVFQDKGNQ